MNIEEYQKFAPTTLAAAGDHEATVINCAMGLVGEVGEIYDMLKKHWFHKKRELFPVDKLIDEGGDVLWYTANFAEVAGYKLLGYTCKAEYNNEMTLLQRVLQALKILYNEVHNIHEQTCDCLLDHNYSLANLCFYIKRSLDNIVEYLQDVFDAVALYLREIEPTNTYTSMLTIENAMKYNKKKLQKRHKNGFTSDYKSDSVQ